jgi:hypothetical protein
MGKPVEEHNIFFVKLPESDYVDSSLKKSFVWKSSFVWVTLSIVVFLRLMNSSEFMISGVVV